jgi:hypothetical protein
MYIYPSRGATPQHNSQLYHSRGSMSSTIFTFTCVILSHPAHNEVRCLFTVCSRCFAFFRSLIRPLGVAPILSSGLGLSSPQARIVLTHTLKSTYAHGLFDSNTAFTIQPKRAPYRASCESGEPAFSQRLIVHPAISRSAIVPTPYRPPPSPPESQCVIVSQFGNGGGGSATDMSKQTPNKHQTNNHQLMPMARAFLALCDLLFDI